MINDGYTMVKEWVYNGYIMVNDGYYTMVI